MSAVTTRDGDHVVAALPRAWFDLRFALLFGPSPSLLFDFLALRSSIYCSIFGPRAVLLFDAAIFILRPPNRFFSFSIRHLSHPCLRSPVPHYTIDASGTLISLST
jgi:hypothetical protein